MLICVFLSFITALHYVLFWIGKETVALMVNINRFMQKLGHSLTSERGGGFRHLNAVKLIL